MKTSMVWGISALLSICSNVYAVGEQGGMSIDNFKSSVSVKGAVTQMTIGDKNNNELLLGSARGNVTMKNFDSSVSIKGAVTQFTLGSGNNGSLLIGSASSH